MLVAVTVTLGIGLAVGWLWRAGKVAARQRREHLKQTEMVVSAQAALRMLNEGKHLVRVSFGYGDELWVAAKDAAVDPVARILVGGRWVEPDVPFSEALRKCDVSSDDVVRVQYRS